MFHRNKHKFKIEFQVTFTKAGNLDKSVNGSTVSIAWKRGKKQSGSTKRALVTKGAAAWDGDSALFSCSCFRDDKSKKFEKKSFRLSLLEDVPKKKPRTLGEVSLDLAPFIKSNGVEALSVPFKKGSSSKSAAPNVELLLRSRYLKIDGKVVLSGADGAASGAKAMQLDGEDFMVKTDSDASQTTVDSASNIDEAEYAEVERMFLADDDDDDTPGRSGPEPPTVSTGGGGGGGGASHHRRKGSVGSDLAQRDWRERAEELETESEERLRALQSQTKELAFVRQQLQKLQQTETERLKAQQALERDKQDLQLQLNALRQYSDPAALRDQDKLRDRLNQLKQESADKDKRLMTMEEEVAQLKRRLQGGTHAAASASADDGDLASKHARLVQEFEEQEALVHKLQHELKGLRKKLHEQQQPASSSATGSASGGRGAAAAASAAPSSTAAASGATAETAADVRQALEEKLLLERCIYAAAPDFSLNVPTAASNLFRSLLGCGAFSVPRPKLLTDVVDALRVTAKRSSGDSSGLAYWLATTVTLLSKLRAELQQTPATAALSTRPTAGGGKAQQPQAQQPQRPDAATVSAFETRLNGLASDVFALLVGSIFRDVEPYLVDLLLAPAASLASPAFVDARRAPAPKKPTKPSVASGATNGGVRRGPGGVGGVSGGGLPSKMALLGGVLNRAVEALTSNHLPSVLVERVLRQLFYRLDAALFNELLRRRDVLCTSSNGFHLKLCVSQLEAWLASRRESSTLQKVREELAPILQAATVLVMDLSDPGLLGDPDVLAQICPALNAAQVLALVEGFSGDPLFPNAAASPLLIERLKEMVRDTQQKRFGGSRPQGQQLQTLPVELDETFVFELPDLRPP